MYESYRSGLVSWKFSSSGPRFEHTSAAEALGDGLEGSQWAEEGVSAGGAGESATIVQRHCVLVGAARVGVVKRRVMVVDRASGVASEKSILNEIRLVCVEQSRYNRNAIYRMPFFSLQQARDVL